MSKAYDRVDWQFLREVMLKLGVQTLLGGYGDVLRGICHFFIYY